MIEKKYPFIQYGGYLHLMPDGALVQVDIGENDPVWRWVIDEVEEDLANILVLCDGTRTINKISDELLDQQTEISSRKEMFNKVKSLIEAAEWQRIISFLDKPRKKRINIQGSKEYFVPVHLYIETTNHCNFKCAHCYLEAGPQRTEKLDFKVLASVLPELAKQGTKAVEITGGEPLMHPDIFRIIDICADCFDIVALLTNGYFVNKNVVRHLKPLIDANKLMVSITINSSSPTFHDKFASLKGAWQRATQAVSLLSEAGALVRFTMNITPENMYDIEDSVALAKSLGAKAFAASPIMPFGRGSNIDWTGLSQEEMVKFSNRYSRLAKENKGFFLTIPKAIRRKINAKHCGAGFRTFVIGPNGAVRPCVNVEEGLLNLGNIKHNPISEILKNPAINALRQLRVPSPATCLGCEHESFCQLCWYRGLIGSKYVNSCKWALENELIMKYIDCERINKIASGCKLKSYHTFQRG